MAEAGPLERLRQGTAPRRLRIAIAEGLVPLDGNDLVEALTILSTDPDTEVIEALQANLPTLPKTFLLQIARDPSMDSFFLDFLAHLFQDDEEILSNLLLNKNISNETLKFLAKSHLPNILNIISDNRNRMLHYPPILKELLNNDRLPRVTRFSLLEFKERFLPNLDEMSEEDFESEPLMDAVSMDSIGQTETPETEAEEKVFDEAAFVETEDLTEDQETDELVQRADINLDELERMMETDVESEPVETSGEAQVETAAEAGKDADGWDIDAFVKEVGSVDEEEMDFEDEFGFEDDIEYEDDLDEIKVEKTGDGWDEFDFELEDDDLEDEEDEEEEEEEKIEDTQLRLMKMSAADKMILAKMGTKQERAILVRDPNKKVATAVINSPKLTEFEVKMFAANRSVCKEVLQEIYLHREWGKRPSIIKELVLNPKTPLAISLKLLNRLNDFDLKEVMKSKEVPYGLSANAKRLFDIRESRRKRRTGA